MKFSTAALLSGAALASGSVLPRGNADNVCYVKTLTVSWIKVEEFSLAETWTYEQTTSMISKSKPDMSQVYPVLNKTTTGSSSAVAPPPGSSKTVSVLPTSKPFSNSTFTTSLAGSSSSGTPVLASSGSVFPTTTGFVFPSTSTTVATTSAALPTQTSSTQSGSSTCQNPAVRVEWSNLSDGQKDAFVSAIACLINTPSSNPSLFPGSQNLYEDLASVHQQLTPQVHNNGIFLVWHRYFVHAFETMLQQKCGYAGPLVWWDETKDAGNFQNAPMFTTRWFGEMHPATSDGSAVCVGDSGFGSYTANIGPDSSINSMHCLSRAVDENQTKNTGSSWVASCQSAQNYDDFRQCNEFTYHAYGHNGIGAVMANVASSPEDPAFYLHHGFIDRNYKTWQLAGSTRNNEVGGVSASGGTVTPSDALRSFGLIGDVTVADVLDTTGGYLCYTYDY